MKNQDKIGVIMLVIFIIFLIQKNCEPTSYEINKKICEEYFQIEIKGIVIKEYRDRKDHNVYKYYIKQGLDTIKRVNEAGNIISDLDQILEVGDSIFKPKNSFKNYIYKKNGMIYYRHGTDCTCGDSIPPDCEEKIKILKQN